MVRDYFILHATSGEPLARPFEHRGPRRRSIAVPAPNAVAASVVSLTEREAAELARDPHVRAGGPLFRTRLIAPTGRRKVEARKTAWGLTAIKASRSSLDGADVTVAVLDTGIQQDHPAFRRMTIVPQDFSGSGNGDKDGHGTHCAGTIFGRDVAGRRIGVARGVSTALIGKVLGDDGRGDTAMLFNGMLWAHREGAQVISMSLGFDFPGQVRDLIEHDDYPPDVAASLALEGYRANLRLFDSVLAMLRASAAFNRGCVVVAASGNESRRTEDAGWTVDVAVPAAADGVIAVGAAERVGSRLRIASFSNGSPKLAGPGVDIVSADAHGSLVSFDGTSMACPHVAGAAVLWWQSLARTRRATPENVVAALLGHAEPGVFTARTPPFLRGAGLVRCP
jgi:subtilisin family serine protease